MAGNVTIPGYGRSTRLAPRWYVGYLTFQGGNPRQRIGSLTGGGFVPPRSFDGTFRPVMKGYTPGVNSAVGAATVVAAPMGVVGLLQRSTGPSSQI